MKSVDSLHVTAGDGPMNKVTTVGIDVAKSVFQFHVWTRQGRWCCAARFAAAGCLSRAVHATATVRGGDGGLRWGATTRHDAAGVHTVKLLAPRYVKALVP